MPLALDIVTPWGAAYRGEVDGVVLPGTEGDFGVLPAHERFLAPLRIGEVTIHAAGGPVYAAIADGFAEVHGEGVTVLVESCEVADQIDAARAELARQRAEQQLSELGDPEDRRHREYAAALRRAEARLAVSQRESS